MGWFRNMIAKMLNIQPAREKTIVIKEPLSYTSNVLKNRIWYRGDPSELSQFFKATAIDDVLKSRFWATVPYSESVRKPHSGIPALMAEKLGDIVVSDLTKIDVNDDEVLNQIWSEISEDISFNEILKESIIDSLVTGDGAFKITLDTDESIYPMISFYSGECVEYKMIGKRLKEIHFYDFYHKDNKTYRLAAIYGKGYINYQLTNEEGKEERLALLKETEQLQPVTFNGDFIWGVPLKFFKSPKFKDRGRSIYDSKTDAFDALDEVLGQWIDAIRNGRVNKYIPKSLLPTDPRTGEIMKPNSFDNNFIQIEKGGFSEKGNTEKIEVAQPDINYSAFVESYSAKLDACLQGIMSPASLGIDLKKTDNAESQREKERATIDTTQKIIDKLSDVIPELISIAMKVHDLLYRENAGEYMVSIEFGEYASPTFNEVVEVMGKAASYTLISTEETVEQLWGDRKDDKWKEEEVKRLKIERGLITMDEPVVAGEDGLIDEPEEPEG